MKLIQLFCFLLFTVNTLAQVGINTVNPDPNTILHINANDKGILIPRLTKAEIETLTTSINATQNGLLVYNTTEECINMWRGSRLQWISLCGDTEAEVDFDNCNTIRIEGSYDIDSALNNQNIRIIIPVNVTSLGFYRYTAVVNGITFETSGTYTQLGNTEVVLFPVSGTVTNTTPANYSGNLIVQIITGGGSISCNISIGFISRSASAFKILNLHTNNDENNSNLIPGGGYNTETAYAAVGEWLVNDTFSVDGTLPAPETFAGTQDVTVENLDASTLGALSTLKNKLDEVSIIWAAGSEEWLTLNPGFAQLIKKWVESGQGIFITTADKNIESGLISPLCSFIEDGSAAEAVPTGQTTMPLVFDPVNGAPYTFTNTDRFTRSGDAVGFLTSISGATIGEIEPGSAFAGNPCIFGDTSLGLFVFGDYFGDNPIGNIETQNFARFMVDIFVWSLKNAPVK